MPVRDYGKTRLSNDGDDHSLRNQNDIKARGVPLRELISCWIVRPESMMKPPQGQLEDGNVSLLTAECCCPSLLFLSLPQL